MAKIKTLKEKQYDGSYIKVYPITSTSAVIDSDGNSVEARLEIKINKPLDDGLPNQVLTTDGNGNCTWEAVSAENLIETTYSGLTSLIDSSQLTPGMQYRIIDYETVGPESGSSNSWTSARHPFDVIVLADSKNKINDMAHAIQSERDTDGYFSNSKLSSWILKYTTDTDSMRFYWLNDVTESVKGVIYYMKDEYDNECTYDFKNVQFYRKYDSETELFSIIDYGYDSTRGIPCYTFSEYVDSSSTETVDSTLGSLYSYSNVYDNVIKARHFYKGGGYQLNNICFFGGEINSNIFEPNCYECTFDYGCYENSFGELCNSIIFQNTCFFNKFGNSCGNIKLNYHCYGNVFGYACNDNKLGAECNGNAFSTNCGGNIFGYACNNNKLGAECTSITLADNSTCNKFGIGCKKITCDKMYFRYNEFKQLCMYLKITSDSTTSESNTIRLLTVLPSMNPTFSTVTISIPEDEINSNDIIVYA